MYITSLKKETNPNSTANVIDKLFAGEDIDNITNTNTITDIIRTVTQCVDGINVDKINKLKELNEYVKKVLILYPEPEAEYITFKIPKRTHGFREINAPKTGLKEMQKNIALALSNKLKVLTHDSAWAYVTGRDVVNAMKEHTNNKSNWYLKLDLHNFFGSCNREFIVTQLKKIYPFTLGVYEYEEYKEIVDELLNNIATIALKDNGLPQGTPLSPILTNLIMVEIDYKIIKTLNNLTKDDMIFKQRYIYTRYADDIIISAKNKFEFKIIIDAITEILKDTPLELNIEKTRFGSASGRNWNLGIMCNKDYETTVGYRFKRGLKVSIHNYIIDKQSNNKWELADLRWLLGQLSWLSNVEPSYYIGFSNYIKSKYNLNIKESIITDIKSYIN